MIDRSKNLCYIITAHYLIENDVGKLKKKSKTFISLHSINTKKAQKFAEQVAREDPQFWGMDEDGFASQETVKLKHLCK